MSEYPHVRHVLFYVPLRSGNLVLAQCGDNEYRILQDDKLVDDQHWPVKDAHLAVLEYNRIKRELVGLQ